MEKEKTFIVRISEAERKAFDELRAKTYFRIIVIVHHIIMGNRLPGRKPRAYIEIFRLINSMNGIHTYLKFYTPPDNEGAWCKVEEIGKLGNNLIKTFRKF